MDIRKLQRAIVDGLEDVKAQRIVVFNTEHLSPLFERVIIASGTSNRQTKALASSVRDTVKARGFEVLRTEGEGTGEWIIVDCGAAVVHVMQPAIRDYYHLEEIWGDKPVRLKSELPATKGGVSAKKPELAAPTEASKKPSTAKKSPAAKKAAPAKRAAAGGQTSRETTTAKRAAPARPAAAKRTVPAKKTAGVPASSAKKAPAKVAPAKKAPAKKAPAKTATAARRRVG